MGGDTLDHFLTQYPQYLKTSKLDELRESDFARLDEQAEVYLDYTGGSLHGLSQLNAHMEMLQRPVFGNPHSDNPSSLRATKLVEETRAAVLDFFQASPEEYCVIFTPNASGALRLIGEAYPFRPNGRFLQLADNHNSVNGIREFARRAGASIHYVESRRTDLRVANRDLVIALADHDNEPHLLAYPAQSNFSGVQHPLEWIELAHGEGWDVVLDAAAFAPTNTLKLNEVKPDFVALSFYKMFGWPTGIGCLIAKRQTLAKLRRPWFSGGTIWTLSVQGDWHIMAPEHEAFEDGTVDYLNIPGVIIGLTYLNRIGIGTIHTRIMCLTDWMLNQMKTLEHANGQPLLVLYGPAGAKARGATIAFNFLDPDNRIVDERIVSREAKKRNISLRTGCFCNPGSGEATFNLSKKKLRAGRGDGSRQSFDHYLDFLGLQSGGAIRISFGLASNFNDALAFLDFAQSFRDTQHSSGGLPARGHC